ncbi:hypothetical protein Bca101_064841 [Brassica carinata]
MRSFRSEFDDLFVEGMIAAIEIGLGTSGELDYPSFPKRMGWIYPCIGCIRLTEMAKQRNHPESYHFLHAIANLLL